LNLGDIGDSFVILGLGKINSYFLFREGSMTPVFIVERIIQVRPSAIAWDRYDDASSY